MLRLAMSDSISQELNICSNLPQRNHAGKRAAATPFVYPNHLLHRNYHNVIVVFL